MGRSPSGSVHSGSFRPSVPVDMPFGAASFATAQIDQRFVSKVRGEG